MSNAMAGSALLPRRVVRPVMPAATGDQIDISLAGMTELIRKKAQHNDQSRDFYGLSHDMFRGVSGIPELPGRPSFIVQEARLQRFILRGCLQD